LRTTPICVAGPRRARRCFGTVDAWLLWNLTGGKVHATDVTNASRTLLFNLHTRDWDSDLCALFGVPRACLPEIRSCSEVYGHTDLLGGASSPPIPIAGMAGDQQAALFGQACFQPGMAKNTYGTGCFLLMNTGPQRPVSPQHGLLSTVAWQINGQTEYALEGSVFVAGAAVQWLRDGLGIIASAQETETLARSVPDTGGVYFVPAFTVWARRTGIRTRAA
jgi:glycerol kinase